MMSSIQICDLCEDVLLLIFDKYLDLRTQLTAQRVCKQFRDIIQRLFDGRRTLYLAEDSKTLHDICEEDFTKYSILCLQSLCRLRDGLWVRGKSGALSLLQPIDIQMLTLKKHKYLTTLCLVLSTRSQLESLMDLILQNCSSNLSKLVLIILNGSHFSLSVHQMHVLCRQYSDLNHFEIFSDYLYASEECFEYLLTNCQKLKVFKLNVRQIFKENIELLGNGGQAITYDAYEFNGSSFRKTRGRLDTINVSQPILSESLIVHRLPLMADRFSYVRHLGVERLTSRAMQTICDVFKSVESFSFSIHPFLEYNFNEIKSLMNCINQLERLNKLSIRWFNRLSSERAALDYSTLKHLKNCSNLKHLILKEAIISEQTIRAIHKSVPSLESLRIVDCTLNKESIEALIGLNQLKQLFVLKTITEQIYFKRDIDNWDQTTVTDITFKCIELGLIDPPKHTVICEMAFKQNEDHLRIGVNNQQQELEWGALELMEEVELILEEEAVNLNIMLGPEEPPIEPQNEAFIEDMHIDDYERLQ